MRPRRVLAAAGWLPVGVAAWAVGALYRLRRALAALAVLAVLVLLLDSLALAGPPWVLLPLAPAFYGLGLLVLRAVRP